LPDFYPNIPVFSSHILVTEHAAGLAAFLTYVFGWEMLRDWILAHHIIPIAAALFAMVIASVRRIPYRGWTWLFALSFWAMMLYHHLGSQQAFCPICIQAYANYFDFLAALAGGVALQGMLQRAPSGVVKAAVICLITAAVLVAAIQSWSLTGVNRLPSIRNQADSLPAEIGLASATIRTLLPRGAVASIVGGDARIRLILAAADVHVPPIFLNIAPFYRKLNEGLTAELQEKTVAEIADLSMWTDPIARQWIERDFDWLVVQRQPAGRPAAWLIWAPEAPLITTALEKCFERGPAPAFPAFDPPLVIELYKRVRRGKVCLGE
jgi:hypothetical protein